MQEIIRIDGSGAELRLGLRRNGQDTRMSTATLRIWRAGVEATVANTLVLQATGVDADWFASFTVPDQWMADNPPGRYTAQLETACGTQLFAVQKGRAPRLGYHSTVEGVCGDVGAVCVAECPGGSLAFVPLGTELLEPLLTEDGFVLVR